jgi:hypothetical protein
MKFIFDKVNKQYTLLEIHSETRKMTQVCGHFQSATQATDFVNKLNNIGLS